MFVKESCGIFQTVWQWKVKTENVKIGKLIDETTYKQKEKTIMIDNTTILILLPSINFYMR